MNIYYSYCKYLQRIIVAQQIKMFSEEVIF